MPLAAATARNRLARRCCAVAVAAALAACASQPGLHQPGRPDAAQIERCRTAERLYRSGSPDYEALRDELARDPVTACWLTRLFVHDLFAVRENRPARGEGVEMMRAAARLADPTEARAIAEIEHLGAAAVPTLVDDLLQNRQPFARELGVELLAYVGRPAVPAVQRVAAEGESPARRAAARTLAAIRVDDEVLATLRHLATDSDFTVRADVMRSLERAAPVGGEILRRALVEDADPFVRTAAAKALAGYRDRASAAALVDHLARCKREGDDKGIDAVQDSLIAIAGSRGPRTLEAWRQWLATYGGQAAGR
jgi:HEAT repeat protein